MCCASAAPAANWLRRPELPSVFPQPQCRCAALSSSGLMLPLRTIQWHHQAGAIPIGLGTVEASLELGMALAGTPSGADGMSLPRVPQGDRRCNDLMHWKHRLASGEAEGRRQTCRNPWAAVGTATWGCGVGGYVQPVWALPWIWILAWPSLLVTSGNFITPQSLHFPCLSNGSGDTLQVVKVKNNVVQASSQAPACWWVQDIGAVISVVKEHSYMLPSWLLVQSCKILSSSRNLSSHFWAWWFQL